MQLHTSSLGTGVVTGQQLIAAPGSGKKIVVTGYSLSVGSTASKVQLIDSQASVNTKSWSFGANGHAESGLGQWELTANSSLELTTTGAGPTDVEVDFVIEATGGSGN